MTDKADKNTIKKLYTNPNMDLMTDKTDMNMNMNMNMDMSMDTSGGSLHKGTRPAPKGPSLSDQWDIAHGVSAGAHGRIGDEQPRQHQPTTTTRLMTLQEWEDSLPPERGGTK